MHWDKTQMLKKFPSDKENGKKKKPSFFFCWLQFVILKAEAQGSSL